MNTPLNAGKPGRFAKLLACGAFIALASMGVHAQLSVSSSGTPSYSYSLSVPPGIAGLAPKVGLAYIGGRNGVAGDGWSIQGVSLITRCPAIQAIDGVAGPVNYTPNDKLCLDGQRLIQTTAAGDVINGAAVNPDSTHPFQTNDSLGGNGMVREYRTEKDSHVRIRAYGIAGGNADNGPAYFKVWTKDGQVYEYGVNSNASSNARITLQASPQSPLNNVVSIWAVSRISDAAGNYIDYQYEQRSVNWGSASSSGAIAGQEWNLLEIRYTGNPVQGPVNKIVFDYSDRADTPGLPQDRSESYYLGAKSVSIRRLGSIRTFVNSANPSVIGPAANAVLTRTYKFFYDNGPITHRSRLTKISECAGVSANQCLSTTFGYSEGGNDVYVPSAIFKNDPLAKLGMQNTSGTSGVLTGDFFGNGRTDILRWADTPSDNHLYRSNGDGSFTQITNGTGPGQFNLLYQNLFKSDGCFLSFPVDFNGDGLTDILRYSNPTNPRGQACASAGSNYLYINKGDGSFTQVPITIPLERTISTFSCGITCTQAGNWSKGSTFYTLDVNGDSVLDLVTTILPRGFNQLPDPCLTQTCTSVYFGNPDGTFTEPKPTNLTHVSLYSDPDGTYTLGSPKQTVDVNGDGLTDILARRKTLAPDWVPSWAIANSAWISQGDGNFKAVTSAGYIACLYPINFNGDGRSDCITASTAGASSNALTLSPGDGTTVKVANFNLVSPGQELAYVPGTMPTGFIVADVNGDGREDILRWKADAAQNAVYLSNGDGTFTASTSFNLDEEKVVLKRLDGLLDFIVGNFTGKGDVEILRMMDGVNLPANSTLNTLYVKSNSMPSDQLISITSPTGSVTQLAYVPLNNSSKGSLGERYTSDRGGPDHAEYPQADVNGPMYVVATLTADSGVGATTVATEYSYKGLKTSNDGRGSLGFREIRSQSPAPNGDSRTTITQALQQHPYIGRVSTSNSYVGTLNVDPSPTQVLNTTSYVYCDLTAAAGASGSVGAPCPTVAKVQRPYLRTVSSKGYDLLGNALPSVSTTSTYDSYGDPLVVTTTTTGNALELSQSFTSKTTNQYWPADISGDHWLIGHLQKTTAQSVVPNSLPSIATSAGTAPNAAAIQGTTITLGVTPGSINVIQSSGAFSATASVSVSGTTQAVTYNWARLAGPTSRITVSGTSPATFRATLAVNEKITETFRLTVTDANGASGVADIPVTFHYVPPIVAAINPGALTVNATSAGTVSGVIAASASGGVGPYSYSWTHSGVTTASSTASATSTISATVAAGQTVTDTWTVKVTDSIGGTATRAVNVTFNGPPIPPTDTLPWTNGSTLSFCLGMGPIYTHTYSFTVGGNSEVVTLSPLSGRYWSATTSGWASGTSVAPGTYSITITTSLSSPATSFPITISFAGTAHTSTATVKIVSKRECP